MMHHSGMNACGLRRVDVIMNSTIRLRNWRKRILFYLIDVTSHNIHLDFGIPHANAFKFDRDS